jgi:hypothetical protein
VDVPVGATCAHCEAFVTEGFLVQFCGGPDDPAELAYHRRCWLEELGL